MVWILFPFRCDFSFRKSHKSQGTKSGLLGDWVTWVIWCFAKKLCLRCDAWAGALLWWSCQSPVAAAFWIIRIVSSEECSSLMQNLMQIHSSTTSSVILNVMATQYTCSLNGVYCPHWQRSHHCSHMCIPVHSPWLLGYIDASQTTLVMLTMAWLFPDRPRIHCPSFFHS